MMSCYSQVYVSANLTNSRIKGFDARTKRKARICSTHIGIEMEDKNCVCNQSELKRLTTSEETF